MVSTRVLVNPCFLSLYMRLSLVASPVHTINQVKFFFLDQIDESHTDSSLDF